MRFVVLSDIHSNLPALEAVMTDIKKCGINYIYCLGDVIGYGKNPQEVLEIARQFNIVIMGNHDEALLNRKNIERFTDNAKMGIFWTEMELKKCENKAWILDIYKFISGFKPLFIEDSILYTHGNHEDNIEYVNDLSKAKTLFEDLRIKGLHTAFVGHTHIPCVFVETGTTIKTINPFLKDIPLIGSERMIINVGRRGETKGL